MTCRARGGGFSINAGHHDDRDAGMGGPVDDQRFGQVTRRSYRAMRAIVIITPRRFPQRWESVGRLITALVPSWKPARRTGASSTG